MRLEWGVADGFVGYQVALWGDVGVVKVKRKPA